MGMQLSRTYVLALAETLLVTFLWSTSFILIKIGLREINPLAFATYRYTIASVVLLLPLLYLYRTHEVNLSLRRVSVFLLLGFTGYFIAQGFQFLGLYYLSAINVTFILNLTPIFVLVFSVLFLKEIPSFIQLMGIVLTLCGVLVFFHGSNLVFEGIIGVVITFISSIGWATYMVISRYYLRGNSENVVVLTSCSMAMGSLMLLGTTVLTRNTAVVSLSGWTIILWLSIVNTSLAFVLWNHAIKTIRAYEQSILQNTMLIQITLLAFVFLNEILILPKILGITIVFTGVLMVQLRPRVET